MGSWRRSLRREASGEDNNGWEQPQSLPRKGETILKKSLVLGSVCAAAIASAAAAEVTLDLGSNTLGGNAANDYMFELIGTMTGFSITFDYVGNTGGSWASDMVLYIIGPGLEGIAWGGFNTQFGIPVNGGTWGFDGPGSEASGTYTDTKTHSATAGGMWTFGIGNGWTTAGPVSYNNVSVTLFGDITFVPAPGAIALLGLAGLAGSRRRRG